MQRAGQTTPRRESSAASQMHRKKSIRAQLVRGRFLPRGKTRKTVSRMQAGKESPVAPPINILEHSTLANKSGESEKKAYKKIVLESRLHSDGVVWRRSPTWQVHGLKQATAFFRFFQARKWRTRVGNAGRERFWRRTSSHRSIMMPVLVFCFKLLFAIPAGNTEDGYKHT